MNSLHIGNSGNKFSLIPNKIKQNSPYGQINKSFLDDVRQIQAINKGKNARVRYNQNLKRNQDHQNKFKQDVLGIKNQNTNRNQVAQPVAQQTHQSFESTQGNNNQYGERQSNQYGERQSNQYGERQNNQTQQHDRNNFNQPQTQLQENYDSFQSSNSEHSPKLSLDVNWTDVFLTVCKKRLFNYFRELKLILNKDPYFNKQLICYIDEKTAKFLVANTKNDKILTLRMMLNNIINQQIKGLSSINIDNSVNLNKALDLIKNLELMGPSNNLLIALTPDKISFLQQNYLQNKQLYWPNGNEGITWLTNLN